jgi:hypothetical protein
MKGVREKSDHLFALFSIALLDSSDSRNFLLFLIESLPEYLSLRISLHISSHPNLKYWAILPKQLIFY